MRVFVLSAGRSGSLSFERACSHSTNYTSAHESNSGLIEGRLVYPDQHIEVDNRLSWFLGLLDESYGDDVHYVHLLRDEVSVVDSQLRRWETAMEGRRKRARSLHYLRIRWNRWRRDPMNASGPFILPGFAYSVLSRQALVPADERRRVCELYVNSVNANIRSFIVDRPNAHTIHLDSVDSGFRSFWAAIGAEGDVGVALGEFSQQHNEWLPGRLARGQDRDAQRQP